MTEILIREAKESDLLTIGKLTLELIEAMGNTEGIDIKLIAENCRNLLSEVNSHILVAEIEGVVAGFVNFTTRKTNNKRGQVSTFDINCLVILFKINLCQMLRPDPKGDP